MTTPAPTGPPTTESGHSGAPTNGSNGAHAPGFDWQLLLDRAKDNVTVESTLNNVSIYLEHHPDFAGTIRWNSYAKQIEVRGGVLEASGKLDPDCLVTSAQNYLAHVHRLTIGRSDLEARLFYAAKKHAYNPLADYLLSLPWDGQTRIDDIFTKYFNAQWRDPDLALHPTTPPPVPSTEELDRLAHLRRIGRRWLLGAVERALRPGSKVDNTLILEGAQGQRKTSALEALGGKWYCSTQITLGDKDSKMVAACNWFVDMPDENFMSKRNKGFMTMREDTYRPPFGRAVGKTPRCCIFVGSINPEDRGYFDDRTGNRRYWPVRCGRIDLVGLMRDRDQIWAEAVALVRESEACADCEQSTDTVEGQRPRCAKHRWWLDEEEEAVAARETAEREEDLPWKLRIHEWWLDMDPSRRPEQFTVEDVAVKALKIDEERLSRSAEVTTAVGIAVKSLGFFKGRATIAGVRHYVYRPTTALRDAPRVAKPARSAFDGPLLHAHGPASHVN